MNTMAENGPFLPASATNPPQVDLPAETSGPAWQMWTCQPPAGTNQLGTFNVGMFDVGLLPARHGGTPILSLVGWKKSWFKSPKISNGWWGYSPMTWAKSPHVTAMLGRPVIVERQQGMLHGKVMDIIGMWWSYDGPRWDMRGYLGCYWDIQWI